MAGPVEIQIDCTEMNDLIGKIRDRLTPKRFQTVMRSEFRRYVGREVRKVVREDIPQDYEITKTAVNKAVKSAKTSVDADAVRCTIPIQGARLSIGGTYKATGGAKGWASLHTKYRVKAKIIKGKQSTLPERMENVGGKPPFRNLAAKEKLHDAAFTRKSKARLPIKPVQGIAIPQMPLNKSRDKIEKAVDKILINRMDHVYKQVLAGVIK